MKREHPKLGEGIAQRLAQRYLKEDGEATSYEDVRSGKGRRRLAVCARDLYRLVDQFRWTAAADTEEYRLLKRLLGEQDHVCTYMLCLMCGFVSYPGVALVLRDRVVNDRSLVVWPLPADDPLPKRKASVS